MALWYYGSPEGQRGPVEDGEMRALIASGGVGLTTLVWREGMESWTAIQFMPELNSQQVPAYLPGQPMLAGTPMYAPIQSCGLAVGAMVCGICTFFTCGTTGIPAVICGHLALSQIRRSPFPMAGKGMAIAGLAMGYLWVALIAAYILFFVVMVGSAVKSGSHGGSFSYPPPAPAPVTPGSPLPVPSTPPIPEPGTTPVEPPDDPAPR